MALIAKGVLDITYSIFNAVVHVLLRDFTNYYWYIDVAEQQNNESIANQHNEDSETLPGVEGSEFVNDIELEIENIPNESFCTSLSVEESVANVLADRERTEGNSMVQNCEVPIQNDTENNENNVTGLNVPEKELSSHIPSGINEIESIEGNDNELNFLDSPKIINRIWVEIKDFQHNAVENNLNKKVNITKKEHSQIPVEKLTETDVVGSQTENVNVATENLNNLNVPMDKETGENTEVDFTLKNYQETEEILFNNDCIEEQTLKNSAQLGENIDIGDGEKSISESNNDVKSDFSSDCELGIRNFKTQTLIGECSKEVKPETPIKKKTGLNKKPRSKISRYVGNNTLLKSKKLNEPKKLDSLSTTKPESIKLDSCSTTVPESTLGEVENVHLQPVTYDEITNTQSLLNELKDKTESDSDATLKFSEVQDDLSEISKVPAEMSDLGSVCSEDSWDSWIGKFVSLMRSKSPVGKPDASVTVPCEDAGTDECVAEGDSCNCIDTHTCLLAVDSDDEVAEDLLSPEQLCSVETGSVSDWLYRVNPPNTLLMSRMSKNKPEMSAIEDQEHNTQPYSESSDEDIAKRFFINQWLDNTETYYTDLNSKFTGSGDIM